MIDEAFILEILKKCIEAKEKVQAEFSELTSLQLNWRPSVNSWSIGQCLDHLIISDCLYFPVFQKIKDGDFKMSFWENRNPLGGFFGKLLATQINEIPNKKLNAPKIFNPSQSNIDQEIFIRFNKHLDSLLNYITGCKKLDIDKINITSPVSKVVTYSLRKAIAIIIQHLHRHIYQALKVKAMKEFPL